MSSLRHSPIHIVHTLYALMFFDDVCCDVEVCCQICRVVAGHTFETNASWLPCRASHSTTFYRIMAIGRVTWKWLKCQRQTMVKLTRLSRDNRTRWFQFHAREAIRNARAVYLRTREFALLCDAYRLLIERWNQQMIGRLWRQNAENSFFCFSATFRKIHDELQSWLFLVFLLATDFAMLQLWPQKSEEIIFRCEIFWNEGVRNGWHRWFILFKDKKKIRSIRRVPHSTHVLRPIHFSHCEILRALRTNCVHLMPSLFGQHSEQLS